MRGLLLCSSVLASSVAAAADGPNLGAEQSNRAVVELGAQVGRLNQTYSRSVAVGGTIGLRMSTVATVEWGATVFPNFGSADWREVTQGLIDRMVPLNVVKPRWSTGVTLRLSPITGQLSSRERSFDVHALVGMGAIRTLDDSVGLQCDAVEPCDVVTSRLHPTTSVGLGARLDLTPAVALRVEVRKVFWVELVEGRYLDARAPTLAQASTTFLLRRSRRHSAD